MSCGILGRILPMVRRYLVRMLCVVGIVKSLDSRLVLRIGVLRFNDSRHDLPRLTVEVATSLKSRKHVGFRPSNIQG
jgi:hypothetical protein